MLRRLLARDEICVLTIACVAAACAAPSPEVRAAARVPALPPSAPISCSSEAPDGLYPPRLVQLCEQQRNAISEALRAHSPFRIDRLRVSSLGEIELYTSDPALVANPPHGGSLRSEEIAGLRTWVLAIAEALHVRGEANVSPTQFVELVDKQPDRALTIAATRILDRVFELTVKTQLVVAMPDPDRGKPLRDRLVQAKYMRIVEMRARPCDPSGLVDTCPRGSQVERTPVQLDASQIVTGAGTIELVRGRGAPKEAHAIGCADIAPTPEPEPDIRGNYLPGRVHYEPIGSAPQLPIAVDLFTGEDLTSIMHASGWVQCVGGRAQGVAVEWTDIDAMP